MSLLQGTLGLLLAVLLGAGGGGHGRLRHHPAGHPRQPASTTSCSPTPRATARRTSSRTRTTARYAKTAIIQRAVEVTEQFAESQGYLARAEAALERANLPLRAGEALFFYAAVVVIATILGLVLGGLVHRPRPRLLRRPDPARRAVSFLAGRRRKKFLAPAARHPPAAVGHAAGRLLAHAGRRGGLPGGRATRWARSCAGSSPRPAWAGRSRRRSRACAERMDSPDFAWAVMAIRIQREVGGNLSELLLTVADTMTQRERLRRDVAALTAEGRMSAIVLGLPARRPGRGHVRHQPRLHEQAVHRHARQHHARALPSSA